MLAAVLWALAAVCLGVACRGEAACEGTAGLWSSEAMPLWCIDPAKGTEILAPNKSGKVIVRDSGLRVEVAGHTLPGAEDAGVPTLAELGWSPDSAGFFVTGSDGGEVGNWQVDVYLIAGSQVRRYDIMKEVEKDFAPHLQCQPPEKLNIGAVGWVAGSRRLVLVAEVPPHSSCLNMGEIRGYLVSVPSGKILRVYSARALRVRWGNMLGTRLMPRDPARSR